MQFPVCFILLQESGEHLHIPGLEKRRHSETSAYPRYLDFNQNKTLAKSTSALHNSDKQMVDNAAYLFASMSDIDCPAFIQDTEEKTSKPKKFDWRLAMTPASVGIGLSSLFCGLGFGGIYVCVPPLGKSSG